MKAVPVDRQYPPASEESSFDVRRPPVWPIVLLLYSTFVPPEISVEIGGLRLFSYRLVLICLVPALVLKLASGGLRLRWIDWAIVACGLWTILSAIVREGLGGLESGGAIALDVVGAYVIGRAYVRGREDFRRILRLAIPGVLLAGGVMALESITGQMIVRPFAASIFGTVNGELTNMHREYRLGLLRAYGPFPHPILGGLQMSSFLPLFLLCLPKSGGQRMGVFGSWLGFFALSSAALIGLTMNLLLVAFDRLRQTSRAVGWRTFIWLAIFSAAFIELFSNSGLVSVVIRYLTFDPQTGYWRLMIWDYGMQNVAAKPWFGGGQHWFRPAWMASGSVDAHYLALAMRDGLPASVFLGSATLGVILLLATGARRSDAENSRLYIGLCISLVTLTLLMFTVTLWGNSYAWFCLLLGMGCALGASEGRERAPQSSEHQD